MKISDLTIQNIRNNLDIVDVISFYLDLKRTGANFKALCPFHNEKTPSFIVSPEKQIFHCFGCGKGGDVIKFVSEVEGLNYFDAAIKLAKDYNISIEFDEDNETSDFFKITMEIAKVFHEELKKKIETKPIKGFLIERGLSKNIIDKFYLGFAPNSSNFILNFIKKNKFNIKSCLKLGIIKEKNNLYDAFRNRIIFPIYNLRGDIIAFGGRTLEKDGIPKYLNSPESPIYHKSNSLYGLFQNKDEIKEKKVAIIVEGYMDLISLYSYGFKNCLATLGTAITERQLNIIKRFTDRIIFLYDSDKAGIKAAVRGAILAINNNLYPQIVLLPNGLDPDDFIKKYGREQFQQYLDEKSYELIDFIKNVIFFKDNLKKFENKIKLMERLKKIYHDLDNPLYKSNFIKGCEDILEISESEIKNYFEKESFIKRKEKNIINNKKKYTFEEKIIGFLMQNTKYLNLFPQDYFYEPFSKKVIIFLKKYEANKIFYSTEFLPEEQDKLRELSLINFSDKEEDIEKLAFYYKKKLQENFLKNKLKYLTNKIRKEERIGESDELSILIKEKNKILEELRNLKKEVEL